MSIREEQIVQQWFINSDVLPKSVTVNFSHIELDELAKKWGMKPKEEVQRDFRYCVLPKGWSKVAHNNSWWVSVLDDRKRPRALIFAAVREEMIPNLIVQRRFDVAIELDHKGVDSVENRARFVVTDCGKTVATGEWVFFESGRYWLDAEKMLTDGEAQLALAYPDWRDPFAYW